MFRFVTFASSSAGNASLLTCGTTHILIDAGISCRRIRTALRELELDFCDLTALCLTHAHGDHINGLATMVKRYPLPVYCTADTARYLIPRFPLIREYLIAFDSGSRFTVADCRITAIPTSHDIPGATGYRFDWREHSLGYLTDTGYVPQGAQELLGAEILVLEANHDVETLLSGPYPYPLKERVLGRFGHLSNEAAASFARDAALAGTRDIILAHLSQENNTPLLALNAVGSVLSQIGYTGRLTAAPRAELSELHISEASSCAVSLSSVLEN